MSVTSQFKRSIALGKLASGILRTKFKRERLTEEKARNHLVERLGNLHGLPQKIGQILALSEVTADSGLCVSRPESEDSLTIEEAKAAITAALACPLDSIFKHINSKGISASLSQVHRAELHDGRNVAVKIQYPGIEKALRFDLKALGWLTLPVGGLNRGFDLGGYRTEIERMLKEELNYEHESQMLKRYRAWTAEWDAIQIPEVIEEASDSRILTMTWMDGVPFNETKNWPLEARRKVGDNLLSLFLAGCFRWRHLHADPHPGNFRFILNGQDVKIGVLDFGCVKKIEPKQASALAWLIAEAIDGHLESKKSEVFERYMRLGFKEEMLAPIADRLPALTKILFEPFTFTQSYEPQEWHLGSRISELLGPYRWNFRMAGSAKLLCLVRAFQGLLQYLRALDVPLDWQSAFERHGRAAIEEDIMDQLPNPRERFENKKATQLKIFVWKSNGTQVQLTFKSALLRDLAELIPEDLHPKLKSRGIEIGPIVAKTLAQGCPPGTVFDLNEPEMRVRVWLEEGHLFR